MPFFIVQVDNAVLSIDNKASNPRMHAYGMDSRTPRDCCGFRRRLEYVPCLAVSPLPASATRR
jgi:hypothetical protein